MKSLISIIVYAWISLLLASGVASAQPCDAPSAGNIPWLAPGWAIQQSSILQPGPGTGIEMAVGEPTGPYLPSARWDVVPRQDVAEPVDIGVVAFHSDGIDRVEFSLNGGPAAPVDHMTLNKRTGVVEYVATFDPQRVPDGRVEVRAVAYPVTGVPRVLPTLVLFANSGGTLVDNTVYLDAGEYPYPFVDVPGLSPERDRWLVYKPMPGVAKEDVVITTGDRARDRYLKFEGVTFRVTDTTKGWIGGSHPGSGGREGVWLENVKAVGLGGDAADNTAFRNKTPQYWTNSTSEGFRFGLIEVLLARNVVIKHATEDGIRNCEVLVDVTLEDIRKGHPDWHADAYQYYIPTGLADNLICYGVTTFTYDWIMGPTQNCAYFNVNAIFPPVDDNPGWGLVYANAHPEVNTYYLRSNFSGHVWWRDTTGYAPEHVVWDRCHAMHPEGQFRFDIPGLEYRD